MTVSVFAAPRQASPGRNSGVCHVFQWIGQSFRSCDRCGRPAWEHLYWPPMGDQRPILYVKVWEEYPTHEERCVVQLHGTLTAPAVCALPNGTAVTLP